MKFYLAARYGRHLELQEYAKQLEAKGQEIISRWIKGDHDMTVASEEDRQRYALEDLEDLKAADWVISFTESPHDDIPGRSRGGRHVEFGMAFMLHKGLVVIGPRENVFHCLDRVGQYDTFEQYLEAEV